MSLVEVFADVRCPFAHVGLRRLVDRRDRPGLDIRLRVRAWPLELVNDRPLDVALVAQEVEALRAQVAPNLFAGFSADTFARTSMPAMALVAAAYERGQSDGERLALALRWAAFEEGRDVADPGVLADVAGAAGVQGPSGEGPDRVLRDWDEGRARGVIGSPHFFVGGQGWFCPMLEIHHDDDGRFRILDDHAAFDAFVEHALTR